MADNLSHASESVEEIIVSPIFNDFSILSFVTQKKIGGGNKYKDKIDLYIDGGEPCDVFNYMTSLTECPCKNRKDVPNQNGLCPSVCTSEVKDGITKMVVQTEEQSGAIIPETRVTNDPIVNKAVTATNCDSERCMLESTGILNYVTPKALREALDNMKPRGPRETRAWLSNFDIDAINGQLKEEYSELYTFPTTMMDFKEQGEELGKIHKYPSIIEGGAEVISAVVNTDKYSSCGGSCGKHWVSVLVDTRKLPDTNWSVEYFDSVGDPPPPEIISWQNNTKKILEEYRGGKGHSGGVEILVNKTPHQRDNNECGVYCAYYNRARVEGISFHKFNNARISDSAMITYRRHVFG